MKNITMDYVRNYKLYILSVKNTRTCVHIRSCSIVSAGRLSHLILSLQFINKPLFPTASVDLFLVGHCADEEPEFNA